MDLTILLAIVSGAAVIVLIFFVFRSFTKGKIKSDSEEEHPRRVPAARGARARLRAAAAAQQRHEADEEEEDDGEHEKIGAKKRAKLEAKAEKKAQREAEEREREEKKKRKEQLEEEKKRLEEKEQKEEEKREEQERREREEQERKEHEEYLKMKADFSIEEEGYDENEMADDSNLLQQFINYIKDTKVVNLEDLAARFKIKTQSVIDRIQNLQANGTLTGVIDDRGKFIYVSQAELESVAKFVKQRGRVTISELAENSQRLINLNSQVQVESS